MLAILLLGLLATLFAGWRIGRRTRYFLHIFQLEGYKLNEYRDWFAKHRERVFFRTSHKVGLGILGAATLGFAFLSPFWTALFALPAWAAAFASSRLYRSEQQKKPLAMTNRMKRLVGVVVTLTLLPIVSAVLVLIQKKLKGVLALLFGLFLADLLAPLWVALGGLFTKPVEDNIQEGFKDQARKKLARRPDLTIVGITGSYGKTSVKFIVAEILRQRYNVLATPGSYNTPMGLCLVVNEKLKAEHQVLVLEYGIRYPGDMRELLEIVRPQIAVETAVGVAHLETMGSQDAIELEKGDLVAGMTPGGRAVLNVDDPRVARMAERTTGDAWRVSVEGREDADIIARDVRYGPGGALFTVRDDTGAEAEFTIQLLGQHNVLNVLLGVAVGRELGLRLRQIARAVRRVEPVKHRLQLRHEGDVTVIDDAFNANPVGARNAVEVLGGFAGGRRVIVTPGMIELGERQEEENRTFGRHIARHADLAVLVGPRQTAPIRAGLADEDYPDEQIRTVHSLFEAQDLLKSYLQPGDVVLYENDLPDQYDEPA